jgi:hypothetical protein
MNSRHPTGHAIDPVALGGGEISWQWDDYSGRRRDAGRGGSERDRQIDCV